ncbi:hypothetical protein [Falsiroseomonas sp. E2-1-a20]|uniref:hypothetical protein n=1 Tax=Falsiroseomonas sp. E2-1-a20 TaxID=3239300 RepID=UPI003F383CE2
MIDASSPPIQERAPLLLAFGPHSSRVAALLRLRPSLMAKLFVAPREALHATGAFLHLSPDAAQPDADVAAIIDNTDPRVLLRSAMPNCPPQLYRSLDRAGNQVRGHTFYQRLSALVAKPVASPLLESGPLSDARIDFYEGLPRMDPALASWISALQEDHYVAAGVDSLVSLLRSHNALRDEDVQAPPRAGLAALTRRLCAALGRIEAPVPPFTIPAPFRLVRNAAELQVIGLNFQNCVALPQWHATKFHFALINGTSVFLNSDEPPLLAVMNRISLGVWHLEQVAGPKNAPPPKGMKAQLIEDLTKKGLKIVSIDPQSALGRLVQKPPRSLRFAGAEDDVGDEDGLDWIAA